MAASRRVSFADDAHRPHSRSPAALASKTPIRSSRAARQIALEAGVAGQAQELREQRRGCRRRCRRPACVGSCLRSMSSKSAAVGQQVAELALAQAEGLHELQRLGQQHERAIRALDDADSG